MPIWIRLTWPAVGASLPEAAFVHLESYVTRYAQTLAVPVLTAEAAIDGLMLMIDLPHDKCVDEVVQPLQEASAKFVRGALGVSRFAWSEEWSAESVSSEWFGEDDEEDALPAWLQEALGESSAPEETG